MQTHTPITVLSAFIISANSATRMAMVLHKDLALDRLADLGNVAQFVAYRPAAQGVEQTFARVLGYPANHRFADPHEALAALLKSSHAGAANIRSYLPEDPRSREFVYNQTDLGDLIGHFVRLAAEGLHLIVNETIDVADGGVSGVVQGEIIEFAPDDTPRAVEKPGIAAFPRDTGLALLEVIYGNAPVIPGERSDRVEFSVHPGPRGWRASNTLLWEIEPGVVSAPEVRPRWPNRFSRHIGDKAYGLLVAAAYGEKVPSTLVIGRRVAPFRFGHETRTGETWIRTCPREPQPGLYTTAKGWRDPFELLAGEDPGKEIASVLAQAGVSAIWSGAAIVGGDGQLIVEGNAGEGDAFMLGARAPEALPAEVRAAVIASHRRLSEQLGPVRIEWVYDGSEAWIVQLHVGATSSAGAELVPGTPTAWIEFEVTSGLPALRHLLDRLPDSTGIELRGEVGLTSHIADVLRKAGKPARIV